MTEEQKKYYGAFEADGTPKGFYPDDVYTPQEDGKRSATIPADAVEITYENYLALLQGHAKYVNDAVVVTPPPPPPPPEVSQQTKLLFDHENRILAQEGQPPLSLGDFVNKMKL